MADRKGPSPASSFFICLAYTAAIALELRLLCHTWWQAAALVGIGFVMFWIVMIFAGMIGIKRHGAMHILLIADLVISALIYKATFG